jgi:cytochrome o ubiquinol oxidase subunit 2
MDWLSNFVLLLPKGAIAAAELGLMYQATFFMLIVAVPVLAITFFFAWHYRASNTKAAYTPDWEHSKLEELIWWAIPLEIVLIVGALTWTSTHELDPRRPLDSALGKPLVVQVVALDSKWLFIYPEQKIATVNYVAIPAGKPVQFEVTADAPMNSFWIPALGGQIYAMTGMVNELHLIATNPGKFDGKSANYSGDGFAKMKFIAEAKTQEDFDAWVRSTRALTSELSQPEYVRLKEADTPEPLMYGEVDQYLFNDIVMKFMDSTEMNGRQHE